MSERDDEDGAADRPLTERERLFVEAYVGAAEGNHTDAAAIAGYNGSREVLRQRGKANLKKPKIKAAIERLNEVIASLAQLTAAERAERLRSYALDGIALPRNVLAQIPPIAEELAADETSAREAARAAVEQPEDGPKTAGQRARRARSIASAVEVREFWTKTMRGEASGASKEPPSWQARMQASAALARAYGIGSDANDGQVTTPALPMSGDGDAPTIRVEVVLPSNGRGPARELGPVVDTDALEVTDRRGGAKR